MKNSIEQLLVFIILAIMVAAGGWYLINESTTMSDTVANAAFTAFGIVLTMFGNSVSYFMGTTLGSAKKNEKP